MAKKSFSEFFDENFHKLDLYAKVIELMDFVLYQQVDDFYVSGAVYERQRILKEKLNAISEYYDLDYVLKMIDYDFFTEDIPDELFFIRRNKETALLLPHIYNIKGTLKAIRWFMSLFGIKNFELVSWWEANRKYLEGIHPLYSTITPPHEWRIVITDNQQSIDIELESKFFEFFKKVAWVNIDKIYIWFIFQFDDFIDKPTDEFDLIEVHEIIRDMILTPEDEVISGVQHEIIEDMVYPNILASFFSWDYYAEYFPNLAWDDVWFDWDSGMIPTNFAWKWYRDEYPTLTWKNMYATTWRVFEIRFLVDNCIISWTDTDWNYIVGHWTLDGILPFKGTAGMPPGDHDIVFDDDVVWATSETNSEINVAIPDPFVATKIKVSIESGDFTAGNLDVISFAIRFTEFSEYYRIISLENPIPAGTTSTITGNNFIVLETMGSGNISNFQIYPSNSLNGGTHPAMSSSSTGSIHIKIESAN